MMLDATAGNRAMWKNKTPPHTLFLDREVGLSTPPDIFAVWQKLPFRDKVFDCVLFDPPHDKFSPSSVHMNPQGWHNPRIESGHKIGGTFWGSLSKTWPADFIKASGEFLRVSKRLCLKWNDSRHDLDKVLSFFKDWSIVQIKEHFSTMRRGKTNTFWVTMINPQFTNNDEESE